MVASETVGKPRWRKLHVFLHDFFLGMSYGWMRSVFQYDDVWCQHGHCLKLVLFFLRMADSCIIWLAGIIKDFGHGSTIKPASKHSGCPCEIGLWGKAVFHWSKTNSLLTHFEKETILKGINPPFVKGNSYWIISHFQLPDYGYCKYLTVSTSSCAPVDGPARAAFGWHCGVHLRHRAGALSDRKMDEAKGEQYGLYLIYTVCIIYIYICLWFYMRVFLCFLLVYCLLFHYWL